MNTPPTTNADEALSELLVAHALYEATRLGLEVATAGRWELELAVRDRVRRTRGRVHEDPRLREELGSWLTRTVERMQMRAAAMRLGAAGRGVARLELEGGG